MFGRLRPPPDGPVRPCTPRGRCLGPSLVVLGRTVGYRGVPMRLERFWLLMCTLLSFSNNGLHIFCLKGLRSHPPVSGGRGPPLPPPPDWSTEQPPRPGLDQQSSWSHPGPARVPYGRPATLLLHAATTRRPGIAPGLPAGSQAVRPSIPVGGNVDL